MLVGHVARMKQLGIVYSANLNCRDLTGEKR